MRIILHIGTHKTGTTAIQKFCAVHRTRLREAGLWYPDYDLIGAEGHYAHHHLAHAIAGLATSRGGATDAKRYFTGLRRQAGADETVLISAEPFCRHVYPPVELSENEYPPGLRNETFQARRRAYIARVREAVGGDDCEVVVVLRRQDRCAESMFKERIKGTGYAGTFNAFREAFSHRFRYFDQVSAWAAFFSKLHVLVYEDLAAQGDLVAGFFGALGVRVPADLAPALQTNISLNNDLIEYKRRLNGSGLDADRHYAVAEAMGADEFNNDLVLDQGSTFWETAEQQAAFLAGFEDQNAHVLERFTELKRNNLFPTMEIEPARPYAGLSLETSREIAARLAALINGTRA